MNQSRFRFIKCETPKDLAVVAELEKPPPASTSSVITASSEYVAAAGAVAGHIALVHGSRSASALNAHVKAVNNLVFSPFDDHLLSFSAQSDFNLHITKLVDSTLSTTSKIALPSMPVCTIWHPSCSSIVLACESQSMHLLDTERCSLVKSHTLECASIMSAAFAANGSEVSAACASGSKNMGSVQVLDPRSETSNCISAELPVRPHCILNVKDDEQCIILGQDQFRKPRLLWFDKRAFHSPILAESLPLSAGISLCCYDPPTSLLSVSTRGSTNMMIFDLSRADRLNHLTTYSSPFVFQGLAAKPRRRPNAASDAAGLFQLATASIETICFSIPTKMSPDCSNPWPEPVSIEPSLSCEEYLQGGAALPFTIRASIQQLSGERQQPAEHPDPSVTEVLAQLDSNKSANRRMIESRLKRNLVAHVSGQETRSLNSFWFGLKPSEVSMPLGRNIVVNTKFLVVPWKSLGSSSIAVIPIDRPGRIEAQIPLLRAHGQQLTCFDLSDLDPGLIVTGCSDAHVRVWRFGANRFDLDQPDLSEPDLDIVTPGKVTFVAVNPISHSVVAVASQAMNSNIISFYDITSKCSSVRPRLSIDCHPEQIISLFFNDDGRLIATACKDRQCRIFDPRKSTTHPVVQFEISEAVRDTYMIWVGQTGCILSIGFGNASTRQMTLWSVLDGDQNALEGGAQILATYVIDQSNTTMVPQYDHDLGLLYIAGVGDRTILFFGIDLQKDGSDAIELLGKFTCSALVSGIDFLPKTMCNVANVEVGSALYLTDDQVRPISFTVPRKRKEYFQDDLFPDCLVVGDGMPASDWFGGKRISLSSKSLQPQGMEKLSRAPPEAITGHQLKRLEFLRNEKQSVAQPTVEEHIQKRLSNVEMTSAPVNRWDAQPIQDKAVAEEEWD